MPGRKLRRREAKARRHAKEQQPAIVRPPVGLREAAEPARVVVREARYVVRLAYNRSQAAAALGVSRSAFQRLLPYVETIELPSGRKLIPVDELERLVAQRRRAAAAARRAPAPRGRPPAVTGEVVERIHALRAEGASLGRIAAALNADGTPTAHGGATWWPSTVRAVLVRSRP